MNIIYMWMKLIKLRLDNRINQSSHLNESYLE
jgi:hypothetical protein